MVCVGNLDKIPIVKFTIAKGPSTSPFSLSHHNDDSENSDQFAVLFDDSVYANEVDHVEEVDSTGQNSEQPKHSRFQQFLSQETNDCDSDSFASCNSENKTAEISKKKLRRSELRSAGTSDRDSISSSDSSFRVENISHRSAVFDKVKRNADSLKEIDQMITVGQDALCVETVIGMQHRDYAETDSSAANKNLLAQSSSFFDWFRVSKIADGESNKAVKFKQPWIFQILIKRYQVLPFLPYRVLCSFLLLVFSILSPGFISGFLWGLYISFVCFLFFFISEPLNRNFSIHDDIVLNIFEEVKERETPRNKIYKGWMNELRGKYDSSTYHVNNAQTVLVCLDGNLLRVSRPDRAVLKHAFHTDPTLTEAEPAISNQSIYNLTGAVVTLRPKRLARRRWWSRKYPIHIRLASRDSEISTFPSLRRSFSMNEPIKSAKSSSSSDDGCDTIARNLVRERKKKMRSPKSIETMYENDTKHPSQENIDGDSQYMLCTENGQGNSRDYVACLDGCGNARGRSLYFFVRSAREKECWFHKLREACSQYSTKISATEITLPKSDTKEVSLDRRFSLPLSSAGSDSLKLNLEYFLYVSNRVQFNRCINEILKTSREENKKRTDSNIIYMDLGRNKWTPGKTDSNSQLVMSVNALAARIFYDFCRDAYWCKQVQDKIQSKLATLHLPYFIETLELSKLDLGTTPPEIVALHSPILDDWGLWIDFELKYRGKIHLTLETKVNLMRLKEGMGKNGEFRKVSKLKIPMRVHHYSDSDLPESPENSPDEDFGSKMENAQVARESTGKKLLNVVDKIASSNIFQGASEFRAVKKMMEGISSTRLLLNVDVICLEGLMTINIPPPPSDRLWYAFRTPPELSIKSVPQVGDRLVDMSTVSSWIENKLRLLLEKNLVCPNMDDLIVPVMSGNELLNRGYNC
uniref:SMP-LTD domain-containing protein n=1 Tax=Onchocerca volvulus TaxID=6282 RepID=A0A8R1TK17_ONCVO